MHQYRRSKCIILKCSLLGKEAQLELFAILF